MMVGRVAELMARRVRRLRIGRVGHRRLMLMVGRRRGRVRMVMMMRGRVVMMMGPRRAVHVVQQIVVRRQGVVLEVEHVRQQRFARALVQLQVAVRLART